MSHSISLNGAIVNRRQFISSSSAAGFAATSAAASASAQTRSAADSAPKRALMKLGCQSAPTSEAHLKYFARFGVKNICGYPTIADGRLYATVEELAKMKDLAEKN